MAHDGQDHAHGGHNHAHGANSRAVGIAALLTFGFMLVEVVGGLWAGSLALLADAGHMLTDVAALGMSWLGFWFARRPADAQRTYGFDRVSVLAAFVNGLALFLVAIFIVVEAVRRFADPQPVVGGVMLVVASLGLLVNVGVFWALSRGDRENLNLRAAILHVAGDLLGSVAAMVAGGVILWTGWTPIDPILSVLVSVIILRAAWRVTAESGHILLEGSPGRLDTRAVRADLQGLAGVREVRHLHAWSISQERPMVTLEAVAEAGADADTMRAALKARLREEFGCDHATVEIHADGGGGEDERLPGAARVSI